MGLLDSLFGGSKTVTQQTSNAPWSAQQPYLQEAFGEAQRLYREPGPDYFPGSTVVPFSPQTEQALQMSEQMALQGSPIQQAGANVYMDTLAGNYLSGSPFFEGAFSAQVAPMVQQFTQEALPGLQSSFSGAGSRGSSAEQLAAGRAMDAYTRALSETGGNLAFQNYANERARQSQFAQGAPAYALTRFQDPQQLANVGAAREDLAQAQLADEINRFNFNQNVQRNKLADYIGLISGGYGSEGTSTQPYFRNVGASLLGGGLAGAELGPALGIGSGAGAGLGGLLALL